MCGIIACCISGIVIVVRFGKYVRVAQCGYERIYYDSQFGQLKDSYPRWEGLHNNSLKLNQSLNIINKIKVLKSNDLEKISLSTNQNWANGQEYSNNYKFKGMFTNSYLKGIEYLINNCSYFAGGYVLVIEGTNEKFYDPKNLEGTIVGDFIKQANNKINQLTDKYNMMEESVTNINTYGDDYDDEVNSTINEFDEVSKDLKNYQTVYLDKVKYYIKVAKGCGYILVIIYLCILGLIAILGCFLLLIYSYLQNQKNLHLFMHIIWNCIRFFVFSFFMYGAAFGMLFQGLRDIIAYNMHTFGNNLNINNTTFLFLNNKAKNFLWNCLNGENTNFKINLDNIVVDDLIGFSSNYGEINNLLKKQNDFDLNLKFNENYNVQRLLRNLEDTSTNNEYTDNIDNTDIISDSAFEGDPSTVFKFNFSTQIKEFNKMINEFTSYFNKLNDLIFNKGNNQLRNIEENLEIYSLDSLESFDCGFLKNDLNLLNKSLYDLSVQSRILCVISCCIGFFGEILIYFYLLSMYHYDTDEFKEGILNLKIKRERERETRNYKNHHNLENSSKNEFLDKSKPNNMKKFNQKLDLDFSNE